MVSSPEIREFCEKVYQTMCSKFDGYKLQDLLFDIMDDFGVNADECSQQFGFKNFKQFMESDCMHTFIFFDDSGGGGIRLYKARPNSTYRRVYEQQRKAACEAKKSAKRHQRRMENIYGAGTVASALKKNVSSFSFTSNYTNNAGHRFIRDPLLAERSITPQQNQGPEKSVLPHGLSEANWSDNEDEEEYQDFMGANEQRRAERREERQAEYSNRMAMASESTCIINSKIDPKPEKLSPSSRESEHMNRQNPTRQTASSVEPERKKETTPVLTTSAEEARCQQERGSPQSSICGRSTTSKSIWEEEDETTEEEEEEEHQGQGEEIQTDTDQNTKEGNIKEARLICVDDDDSSSSDGYPTYDPTSLANQTNKLVKLRELGGIVTAICRFRYPNVVHYTSLVENNSAILKELREHLLMKEQDGTLEDFFRLNCPKLKRFEFQSGNVEKYILKWSHS